ncbi:hypothetical protein KY289_017425 [Solanum tuberosum]|nr:hypothetical protein KY289_017425 [Solanum tuberosum]
MSNTYYLPLYLAFVFLIVLLLNLSDILLVQANGESKVHVVNLGRRKHDDVELTTSSHHQILSSVLGSQEAAKESIIYSYRHGFSGFAAKLTEAQAKRIAELPDVVHVVPNHFYQLHTRRSWDYLGLSTYSPPTNLLHEANMGDGIIIGEYGQKVKHSMPIPSRWKGRCESGERFDPAKACNRKLIGADVIMAIDQAIHDGVDILSMSLGSEPPLNPNVDFTDGGQFASLSAVTHGITVVSSAGNKGSLPQTVGNISPWMLTVAASSIDRSLPTLITLGNNRTFVGQPCILERRLLFSTFSIYEVFLSHNFMYSLKLKLLRKFYSQQYICGWKSGTLLPFRQ